MEAVAAEAVAAAETVVGRAEKLKEFETEVSVCMSCALSQGRTQVVFGQGNSDADLMFIGEAPGFHEDKQGYPFVGRAGRLLEKLLEGIGMTRDDVYIANVLKCRPPANRDPRAEEIEACERHLFKQVSIIEPNLIATLGNFATKLLSGSPDGITRVHGEARQAIIGGREVMIFPVFHPAAALYTPSMLKTLEADFAKIPDLITASSGRANKPEDVSLLEPVSSRNSHASDEQLDLF